MVENIQAEQGVDARVAAARLLNNVLQNNMTVSDALASVSGKMRLPEVDKKLVHAISGIVFRHLPEIDAILRRVMDRNRDPSPIMLHHLLRVGVAQLLWMEVAPHAAVHTSVSAAVSLHLGRQKSLVNGVLRSVQRQKESLVQPGGHALSQHPEWLRARWVRHYGETRASALAEAAAHEAPIDVSLKGANSAHDWAQKLGGMMLDEGTVRVHQGVGQVASWPGFHEGEWWVQDMAASLPIKMLGDVSGKSVLDVCAAPGGKSMQLATRGATVTALDASTARMARLKENIQRIGLEKGVKTVVADAINWQSTDQFNVVVLDAPCSSTGTLRRHPELPWIHCEKDVEKMVVVQHDLLRRMADFVMHDGILLYCTCSMEVEEGEAQVKSFLSERKDFKEITDIPPSVHPFLVRGNDHIGFRSFPDHLADHGGMDGFFMALLQKI